MNDWDAILKKLEINIRKAKDVLNQKVEMQTFRELACPSNLTIEHAYESGRDLVAGITIRRGAGTNVVLRNYTYDTLARPLTRSTSRNGTTQNDTFGYNSRSELVSATLGNDEYAYAFDNIGNRNTASEVVTESAYSTNNLNQYTEISLGEAEASPLQYDADGNVTSVQTSTGTWSITYNGENRPVRFENAATQTVVDCAYDSQGRRFEKKVTVAGTTTLHHRYIYRGYLQIAALDLTRSAHPALWLVTWDPSQPTATRLLAIQKDGTWFTYGYDITKNVCELFGPAGYIRTAYSDAPFGAVTESGDVSQPFQWSSEVYDSELDLVYYNYRHYSPSLGRFLSRDPIEEQGGLNLYAFIKNKFLFIELLGLKVETNLPDYGAIQIAQGVSKSWFEGEFRAVFDSARITLGKNKEFVITGPTPSMAVKYNEKIFKSVEEFKKSRTYTFHEKRHFDDFSRFYKLYAEDLNFYEGKKCPKCIENLKTYSRLLFSRLKMKLKKAEMVFHYDDYSVENLLREYNAIRTSDTPQIKRRYNEPNHIFYGRIYEAYESIINEKKEEIETIELEVVKAKEKLDECIKK